MNETQTQTEATKGPEWQNLDESKLGVGLYAEKVNFDAGADAFAVIPPVPDGKYAATLGPSTDSKSPTLQVKQWPATAEKPALTVIRINATLTLTTPLDPGVSADVLKGKTKTFDKAFSTQVKTRNGQKVSEAVTLLSYLGYNVEPGTSAEVIAKTLLDILKSGQAQIGVKTVWKAGFQEGEVDENTGRKAFGSFKMVGMSKFPLLPNGTHNPVLDDRPAKAYISDVFSLTAKQ